VRSEAGTSTARTFAGVLVPPACRLGATCGAGVRLWRRGGGRRRLNANSATATATKPHRGVACLSQSRFPQAGRALSTPRSLNVPYPAITTLSSSRVFFFCGVLHTPYVWCAPCDCASPRPSTQRSGRVAAVEEAQREQQLAPCLWLSCVSS
jgi:hypothetical protein